MLPMLHYIGLGRFDQKSYTFLIKVRLILWSGVYNIFFFLIMFLFLFCGPAALTPVRLTVYTVGDFLGPIYQRRQEGGQKISK